MSGVTLEISLYYRNVDSNGVAVAVPAELWNELSVQTDAQGKVQVHEADATGVAVTVEGDANE